MCSQTSTAKLFTKAPMKQLARIIRHPALLLLCAALRSSAAALSLTGAWPAATPESQGLVSHKLETLWADLKERRTTAFLVIRHAQIIFERYAAGYDRAKPHSTASLAKALVGGVSLSLAMNDHLVHPDAPASR